MVTKEAISNPAFMTTQNIFFFLKSYEPFFRLSHLAKRLSTLLLVPLSEKPFLLKLFQLKTPSVEMACVLDIQNEIQSVCNGRSLRRKFLKDYTLTPQ